MGWLKRTCLLKCYTSTSRMLHFDGCNATLGRLQCPTFEALRCGILISEVWHLKQWRLYLKQQTQSRLFRQLWVNKFILKYGSYAVKALPIKNVAARATIA